MEKLYKNWKKTLNLIQKNFDKTWSNSENIRK